MPDLQAGPGWPPLAGVVVLVGAYLAGMVVLTIVAIGAGIAGYEPEDVPAGLVLVLAVLFAAAAVAVCLVVAAQTARPTAEALGLRPPPPGETAVLVAGGLVVMAIVGALWAWGAIERLALPVPAELDPGPDGSGIRAAPDVDPGAGLAASALARAVIAPFVLQVVVLGFVLPALSRWRGVVPAALVCGLVLATSAGLVGDGGRLALPALALAAVLVALRLRSGSVVPGIVVTSAVAGTALGTAVRWELPGALVLGLVCAVVALAAALALSRPPR